MTNSEKLDYNRKMIGKTIQVLDKGGNHWFGEVKDVKDDSNFLVTNHFGVVRLVSIFDVRNPAQ
jgi:hypothetical protein